MLRSTSIRLTVFSALLALASTATVGPATARGQDDEEEAAEEEAPAPEAAPTTTGRGALEAVVGQRGMTFEITGKARLVVPPGLPIGNARRMHFAEARGTFRPTDVAPGFRRIGPVLAFDGAVNATSSPIVLSTRVPRDPSRAGERLVVAMEQAAICRPGLTPLAGAGGLCSGWELVDASWATGELRAELRSPGGYRLVFGSVPVAAPQ